MVDKNKGREEVEQWFSGTGVVVVAVILALIVITAFWH